MKFLDFNVGWPSSCNDKRVLRDSRVYILSQGEGRLKGAPFTFQKMSIPEYIVGDGGYVPLPWLIIPFQYAWLVSQRR